MQDRGFADLVTRTSAELDLRDPAAVEAFFAEQRPATVVMAAAKVGGILANSTYPADFLSDNLRIQVNVLDAAARLELPTAVTAVVPAAENAVSDSSYRPSDVVRHVGGRTTEVLNTDAEGRMVLADGLAHARLSLGATVLVDVATLTGAMKVALGARTASPTCRS